MQGFDASSAATATRNILNLADANGDLAKSIGHPVKKNLDEFGCGKQLDAEGIDLAQSLELSDKRSAALIHSRVEGGDVLNCATLSTIPTAQPRKCLKLWAITLKATLKVWAARGMILCSKSTMDKEYCAILCNGLQMSFVKCIQRTRKKEYFADLWEKSRVSAGYLFTLETNLVLFTTTKNLSKVWGLGNYCGALHLLGIIKDWNKQRN